MPTINRATIAGNVGQDAQLRRAANNDVCNFQLAITKRWTDDQGQKHEDTSWLPVVAWGQTARVAARLAKKGAPLYVEGELVTRRREDKGIDVVEVRAFVVAPFHREALREAWGPENEARSKR